MHSAGWSLPCLSTQLHRCGLPLSSISSHHLFSLACSSSSFCWTSVLSYLHRKASLHAEVQDGAVKPGVSAYSLLPPPLYALRT
jgi:hypothetical protein